jgi:hypothetical protein
VLNTEDSGPGSFRQAILDANANPGYDTIDFQVGSGVAVIQPRSPLPFITDSVLIDGTTQPGFAGTPLVVLDGTLAGTTNAFGLLIQAGGSTVQGLVIGSFHTAGIVVETHGANLITGNYMAGDCDLWRAPPHLVEALPGLASWHPFPRHLRAGLRSLESSGIPNLLPRLDHSPARSLGDAAYRH